MLAKQTRSPLLPPYWLRMMESNHQLKLMRLLRYRFSNPRLIGSPSWARTTDIDINSVAQLPTVLTGNKFGGAYWDRTSRAIKTADLQSTASPLMLLLHVLIVTLSLYDVNRFAGGGGECVLKHSTWMNPLAQRPENALIRCNFSH